MSKAVRGKRDLVLEERLVVPKEVEARELLHIATEPPHPAIVMAVRERPHFISELARQLSVPKATMTRHLGCLEAVGWVRELEDDRKWTYYDLTRAGETMFDFLRTLMAAP